VLSHTQPQGQGEIDHQSGGEPPPTLLPHPFLVDHRIDKLEWKRRRQDVSTPIMTRSGRSVEGEATPRTLT